MNRWIEKRQEKDAEAYIVGDDEQYLRDLYHRTGWDDMQRSCRVPLEKVVPICHSFMHQYDCVAPAMHLLYELKLEPTTHQCGSWIWYEFETLEQAASFREKWLELLEDYENHLIVAVQELKDAVLDSLPS